MSIFNKSSFESHPPAVRTIENITLERDKVRARIADFSARRDALTAEKAALGIEQNPSTSWRSEKIAAELQTLTSEIKKDGRFEQALAYELQQLQLPVAREEAERLAVKAEQALAALDQAIRAAVPVVMDRAAKALELIEAANVAHALAERIAGEIPMRRFDFDRQTVALLHPLYAYGAGLEWNERIGKPIPLGALYLQGA